jgi:hypothetical protein
MSQTIIAANKGFYTDEYNVPDGGFKGCVFLKHVLAS